MERSELAMRGMSAVINKLAGDHPAHVNELFKTVAMTLVTSVGGASGPLYGTFFLRFAGATGPATELDAEALDMALRAGLSGIVRMHQRPQGALFKSLRQLGYRVETPNDRLPAVIYGEGAKRGRCVVSIEESSQFASALLLSGSVTNAITVAPPNDL